MKDKFRDVTPIKRKSREILMTQTQSQAFHNFLPLSFASVDHRSSAHNPEVAMHTPQLVAAARYFPALDGWSRIRAWAHYAALEWACYEYSQMWLSIMAAFPHPKQLTPHWWWSAAAATYASRLWTGRPDLASRRWHTLATFCVPPSPGKHQQHLQTRRSCWLQKNLCDGHWWPQLRRIAESDGVRCYVAKTLSSTQLVFWASARGHQQSWHLAGCFVPADCLGWVECLCSIEYHGLGPPAQRVFLALVANLGQPASCCTGRSGKGPGSRRASREAASCACICSSPCTSYRKALAF